ncbi:MAG: CBS domain-containing protein [Chloroflexi bacterium]|nr:CBS domain-containing protein [Chloroflexota bacterium]
MTEAEEARSQGNTAEAFRKAFGALEACYTIAARERGWPQQKNANNSFMEIIKFLRVKQHITEEQFLLADYLRLARNVVVHKYGFEPSLKEAESTISRVGQLCAPFGKTVSDVMAKPVKTVSPDQPVGEVVRSIVEDGISQFPVVESGAVVGTVLESQVLDAWEKGEGMLDPETPVRDIMDKVSLPSIPPDATLDEVKKRFLGGSSPAFLILHEGMPIGIITKYDLLRQLDI